MREALVDVLVDDVRLVQHEVALDQHRHLVVRIHHREVLGLVVQVDVDDLEVHSLLVQHDAAALAERVGRPGIEGHHRGSPLCAPERRFLRSCGGGSHRRERNEARSAARAPCERALMATLSARPSSTTRFSQ